MIWDQDSNYSPEAEETSWNEDDWERFFQEQDKRAEQYQKKFEEAYDKYKEQYPDDHELSQKIQSDLTKDNPAVNSHWLESSKEAENEFENMEPWEKEEQELEFKLQENELDSLSAYQYAMRFGLEAPHLIKSIYEQGIDTPEVHQLHLHCYQIGAHIAGGHALGYDKDGLTGNIAKLRRALKSANLCLDALLAIKRKHLTENDAVEKLIQYNISVRDSLIHRIEELRHQVWW